MATTSPDNIWTPDAGDDYALTVDLAAMADTVQDALNKKANSSDSGLYYTRNGSYTWGTSDTRIIWDNQVINSSEFSYSNGVFTCQKAGVYDVAAQATVGGQSTAGQIAMAIRDGSNVSLSESFGSRGTAHIQSLNTATLRSFNVGNSFSVTVISTGQSAAATAGGQGTWVKVTRAR